MGWRKIYPSATEPENLAQILDQLLWHLELRAIARYDASSQRDEIEVVPHEEADAKVRNTEDI
jgi:hypothetical protein